MQPSVSAHQRARAVQHIVMTKLTIARASWAVQHMVPACIVAAVIDALQLLHTCQELQQHTRLQPWAHCHGKCCCRHCSPQRLVAEACGVKDKIKYINEVDSYRIDILRFRWRNNLSSFQDVNLGEKQ